LNNSEIYECEHGDKVIRKIQPEYIIKVCDICYEEFINIKTRPLFLAKQILSLSNKMIEKTPEFNDKQSLDKSIKSWHDCNTDVLEQLKKLNCLEEDKENNPNITKDETNYNFEQILHETEINVKENEQNLDGENLHNFYRHSTKLIK
jgi:hypothetical protein